MQAGGVDIGVFNGEGAIGRRPDAALLGIQPVSKADLLARLGVCSVRENGQVTQAEHVGGGVHTAAGDDVAGFAVARGLIIVRTRFCLFVSFLVFVEVFVAIFRHRNDLNGALRRENDATDTVQGLDMDAVQGEDLARSVKGISVSPDPYTELFCVGKVQTGGVDRPGRGKDTIDIIDVIVVTIYWFSAHIAVGPDPFGVVGGAGSEGGSNGITTFILFCCPIAIYCVSILIAHLRSPAVGGGVPAGKFVAVHDGLADGHLPGAVRVLASRLR